MVSYYNGHVIRPCIAQISLLAAETLVMSHYLWVITIDMMFKFKTHSKRCYLVSDPRLDLCIIYKLFYLMNYTYASIYVSVISVFSYQDLLLRLFFWTGQTGKSSNEPELDWCIWEFVQVVPSRTGCVRVKPCPGSSVDCGTTKPVRVYCIFIVSFLLFFRK